MEKAARLQNHGTRLVCVHVCLTWEDTDTPGLVMGVMSR